MPLEEKLSCRVNAISALLKSLHDPLASESLKSESHIFELLYIQGVRRSLPSSPVLISWLVVLGALGHLEEVAVLEALLNAVEDQHNEVCEASLETVAEQVSHRVVDTRREYLHKQIVDHVIEEVF